jgi:hypothetical protein
MSAVLAAIEAAVSMIESGSGGAASTGHSTVADDDEERDRGRRRWFLGDYTGLLVLDPITKKSPPSFVWFLGWVVLLLPVIMAVLIQVEGIGPNAVLR